MKPEADASQQKPGPCAWCQGRGFFMGGGEVKRKCPKCDGTGKAPKVTTK